MVYLFAGYGEDNAAETEVSGERNGVVACKSELSMLGHRQHLGCDDGR